ncbi:hypothetical protein DPMN_023773 [Dreissena polymorpha]|uniref:Uncharacterized protein n=1 Tax=Dreissena polymorpha TaxID=45954 RepID=A0A9D4RC36_DREPO|nr:hypothetical protein DPMN_023773 [Dreissena polymorpha]
MQLGKERAVITPAKIENWFHELRSFLKDEVQDPDLIRDPSRLYYADETGFPLCPKSGKVLSMKGAKHVYNYTSSNESQIPCLRQRSRTLYQASHCVPG